MPKSCIECCRLERADRLIIDWYCFVYCSRGRLILLYWPGKYWHSITWGLRQRNFILAKIYFTLYYGVATSVTRCLEWKYQASQTFFLENDVFQNITKCLGNFCKKICCQNLPINPKSGHTGSNLFNSYPCKQSYIRPQQVRLNLLLLIKLLSPPGANVKRKV